MTNSAQTDRHPEDLSSNVIFLATRIGVLGAAAANRVLADFGLRVRSYSVLVTACTRGPLTQKEIAEELLLDPSQVVSLLDSLESADLVRRIPDASDRRARLVTVTDQGRRVFQVASDAVAKADERTLSSLSSAERDQLLELLRRAALTSGAVAVGADA